MLHLISQDLKAIARRTLGEIFPSGTWITPDLPERSETTS
jgi:hypothetical protein